MQLWLRYFSFFTPFFSGLYPFIFAAPIKVMPKIIPKEMRDEIKQMIAEGLGPTEIRSKLAERGTDISVKTISEIKKSMPPKVEVPSTIDEINQRCTREDFLTEIDDLECSYRSKTVELISANEQFAKELVSKNLPIRDYNDFRELASVSFFLERDEDFLSRRFGHFEKKCELARESLSTMTPEEVRSVLNRLKKDLVQLGGLTSAGAFFSFTREAEKLKSEIRMLEQKKSSLVDEVLGLASKRDRLGREIKELVFTKGFALAY